MRQLHKWKSGRNNSKYQDSGRTYVSEANEGHSCITCTHYKIESGNQPWPVPQEISSFLICIVASSIWKHKTHSVAISIISKLCWITLTNLLSNYSAILYFTKLLNGLSLEIYANSLRTWNNNTFFSSIVMPIVTLLYLKSVFSNLRII